MDLTVPDAIQFAVKRQKINPNHYGGDQHKLCTKCSDSLKKRKHWVQKIDADSTSMVVKQLVWHSHWSTARLKGDETIKRRLAINLLDHIKYGMNKKDKEYHSACVVQAVLQTQMVVEAINQPDKDEALKLAEEFWTMDKRARSSWNRSSENQIAYGIAENGSLLLLDYTEIESKSSDLSAVDKAVYDSLEVMTGAETQEKSGLAVKTQEALKKTKERLKKLLPKSLKPIEPNTSISMPKSTSSPKHESVKTPSTTNTLHDESSESEDVTDTLSTTSYENMQESDPVEIPQEIESEFDSDSSLPTELLNTRHESGLSETNESNKRRKLDFTELNQHKRDILSKIPVTSNLEKLASVLFLTARMSKQLVAQTGFEVNEKNHDHELSKSPREMQIYPDASKSASKAYKQQVQQKWLSAGKPKIILFVNDVVNEFSWIKDIDWKRIFLEYKECERKGLSLDNPMLEVKIISNDDPREWCRGKPGVFVKDDCYIPKGTVLGPYCCETYFDKEWNRYKVNSGEELEMMYEFLWTDEWRLTDDDSVLLGSLLGISKTHGNMLRFIKDFRSEKGDLLKIASIHKGAANCAFVELCDCGWPYPFVVAVADIHGGEEVLQDRGEEFHFEYRTCMRTTQRREDVFKVLQSSYNDLHNSIGIIQSIENA